MHTWVAYIFWLLWIMLLWTRVCKYLFEFLLSLFMCMYPKVEIAGPCGNSVEVFEESPQQPPCFTCTSVSISPHPCLFSTSLLFSVCLFIAFLLGVKWYLKGFDLHFCNGWWCWASFYVFIDHSDIFFGKMSMQAFCPFLVGLFLLFGVAGVP